MLVFEVKGDVPTELFRMSRRAVVCKNLNAEPFKATKSEILVVDRI